MMRVLFAVSSGILVPLVLQGLPDSGLEVVESGWMMLVVKAVKLQLSIVGIEDGASITAVTMKMPQSNVMD